MENTPKIIFALLLSFVLQSAFCQNEQAFCQNEQAFCKAVDNSKFNKVERIFKQLVNKNKIGYVYANEENGWGIATSYYTNYQKMMRWLKKQPCVVDVFWDSCQSKPAIYPGHSTIGVKFNTKNGIVEKCFLIQEGTTGQVNILGYRPKLYQTKKILVYKKMYYCKDFIEQQKLKCGII
jgi:hypothetical protein